MGCRGSKKLQNKRRTKKKGKSGNWESRAIAYSWQRTRFSFCNSTHTSSNSNYWMPLIRGDLPPKESHTNLNENFLFQFFLENLSHKTRSHSTELPSKTMERKKYCPILLIPCLLLHSVLPFIANKALNRWVTAVLNMPLPPLCTAQWFCCNYCNVRTKFAFKKNVLDLVMIFLLHVKTA